ncbi:MAG: hypothetical protein RLZZ609_2465 [Cyanobacteriota bacterium]|jgi:CHAT domain-containing protein
MLRVWVALTLVAQPPLALANPAPTTVQASQAASHVDAIIERGELAWAQGDLQKARNLWLQALAHPKNSTHSSSRARLLLNIATAEIRLNEAKEAESHLQISLQLARQLGDLTLQGGALYLLGILASNRQNHPLVIVYQSEHLLIAERLSDLKGMAVALYELGKARMRLQQDSQALIHLEAAHKRLLQLTSDPEAQEALGKVERAIGDILFKLGDFDHSVRWYQGSLAQARATGSKQAEAHAIARLAALHYEKRDYAQATLLNHQGLTLAKQIKDTTLQATLEINLGHVALQLGNRRQARHHYLQGLALATKADEAMLLGESDSALALLEGQEGNYQRALDRYQIALRTFERAKAPKEQARTLNNRAYTQLQAGALRDAETDLTEALAILDGLRIPLNDQQRIALFSTQVSSYNLLQQVLVADRREAEALVASERGRAQAFLARLAEQSQRPAEPLTLENVRSLARSQQTTFVEYSLIPEDSFIHQGRSQGVAGKIDIWVVQPSGAIHFQSVDLQERNINLDTLIDAARAQIAEGKSAAIPLRRLHQLLVEPIAQWLPSDPKQKVVVVPHQGLFLVPFPALLDSKGQFLIDRHTLATTPSIQVIDPALHQRKHTRPSSRSPSAADVLIVGNPVIPSQLDDLRLLPLRGSQREAQQLQEAFFPNNVSLLVGRQATETAIKAEMPMARVIHLAAHGVVEQRDNLENGAIVLTKSAQDDGLLTYAEVSKLDLRADLVVLSACDTGRGVLTGDGVVGLSRAFLGAGARTVVVSLWRIPDQETSELMHRFYGNLRAANGGKAQALRDAMRGLKASRLQPIYWAGFTLIGDSP